MEHLLFAGYLVLFAWLCTKVRFFRRSGLSSAQLIIVFLLKVMAGIFYGWIGVYYGNMAKMVDTWAFQHESIAETRLLLSQPLEFVLSVFRTGYAEGYAGFLGAEHSWWNNLDVNIFTKLIAVFNVLSFGQYFINVIFYSFITLFGPVALYRVFADVFPDRKIAVLLAVFLIPSFIYWTSGLHKDGLLFNGIALPVYVVYFALKQQRLTILRVAAVLLSAVTLLVLRNYVLLVLVPALLAWVLAARLRARPMLVFGILYAFYITLFFAGPFLSPHLNFPAALAQKQAQFLKLRGNSEVNVSLLQPSPAGFLANLPQALSLTLVRPYFSDIRHLLSLAAAVEINLLLALSVLSVVWRFRGLQATPFALFTLLFSLSVLVIVGYTVNFLGAIVRYRSIVLPLLYVPLLVQLPWQQAGGYLLNITSKNNT